MEGYSLTLSPAAGENAVKLCHHEKPGDTAKKQKKTLQETEGEVQAVIPRGKFEREAEKRSVTVVSGDGPEGGRKGISYK